MMRDKIFFNILLVIIPVYFLQGWIFDSGSLVSQSLVAVWLFIDIIYLVKCLRYIFFDKIGRYFFIFWLVNTLIWLISPILSNNSLSIIGWGATYSVYKNISVVFLTYFPFYYFTYKKIVDKKQIRKFTLLSLTCLIAAFFISARESIFTTGQDEVTNNGAYYLVVIIPLLGVFFYEVVEYIFFGGILILVLTGAKRGALLCAVFDFMLFIYFYFKNIRRSRNLFKYICLLLAVVVIVSLGIELYEGSEYLKMRYEQTISGDTSARDELYSLALQKFQEEGFVEQIFGNGMNSTLAIVGGYAHQDWLELLINNGLVGVFSYLLIFLSIFIYYYKNHKFMGSMESFMYLSAAFSWLLRSMYSMAYYSIETCFLVITFAYVCANRRKII